MVAASLLLFQTPSRLRALSISTVPLEAVPAGVPPLPSHRLSHGLRLRAILATAFLFNAHNVAVVLFSTPWLIFSIPVAATVIVGATIPYILITFSGNAAENGRRRWPLITDWVDLFDDIFDYMNSTLVNDGEKLDPNNTYLFSYQPHGIFPSGAVVAPRTSYWRSVVGEVDYVPLTASATLKMPVTRDLSMWLGMREITPKVFLKTLRDEKKSALVVPGGQAEMLECRSDAKELVVITRHKGFLKMVLRTGATLVPVFAFGETRMMDNIQFPRLQRWCVKNLRALIPFYPHGAYFFPYPRIGRVGIVVGKPLPACQPIENPTEEQVDALHKQYYKEIHELYYKYRDQFGHADIPLVFK